MNAHHPYGDAVAYYRVRTSRGSFLLCEGCAEAFHCGLAEQSEPDVVALDQSKSPVKCQCEHVHHFPGGQ